MPARPFIPKYLNQLLNRLAQYIVNVPYVGITEEDVQSALNGLEDRKLKIGTAPAPRNISGAVVVDINAGDYQKLTATASMDSLDFTNELDGSWGVIIEAINWGNHSSGLVLGAIEVPGGTLTLTTDGKDKLVLSGKGSNASIDNSQADLQ